MSCAQNSVTNTTYVCEGHCYRGRVAAVCCPVGSGSQAREVCFIGLSGIRVLCGTVCIGAITPTQLPNPCNPGVCGQQIACYRPPCGLVSGGWVVLGGKSKCYAGQWNSSCCGTSTCEPTTCFKWSLEYPVTSETPMSCSTVDQECYRPRWYRLGQGVVTIQTGAGAVFQLLDVEATTTVLQPTIQVPWQYVTQSVLNLQNSLVSIVKAVVPIPVLVQRFLLPNSLLLGPCSGRALVYALTSNLDTATGTTDFAAILVWGSVVSTLQGSYNPSNGQYTISRAVSGPIGTGISTYARILFPGDVSTPCNPVVNDPSVCGACCPRDLNTVATPCESDDSLIGLSPAACTILPQGIQFCGCPEAPVHSFAQTEPVQPIALSALDSATRDFCSSSSCENVSPNAYIPAASVDRLVGIAPFISAVPNGAVSLVMQPAAVFQNADLLPKDNDILIIVPIPDALQQPYCPYPKQPVVPVIID